MLGTLLEKLSDSLANSEGVIISDYAKGVVVTELSQHVIQEAVGCGKFVAVDPKEKDFSKYQGATVITPNQAEFETATGDALPVAPSDSRLARRALLDRTSSQALLVTRGQLGMVLYHAGESKSIRASAREVFDVTGAGDAVSSTVLLGRLSGWDLHSAAWAASRCASIAIGRVGTHHVSLQELRDALAEG